MNRLSKLLRAIVPGAILFFATAAWAGPYGATYNAPAIGSLAAGEVRVVNVTVTNTGTKDWLFEACKDRTVFGLAYHWEGPQAVFDGERTYVPKTVKAGQSITLPVMVAAPSVPGAYTLRFDMVEEGMAWFSQSADQVPTQNQAITVTTKPVAGKITGIAFNYENAAPGLSTFKVVPVGNDCPFDVDFGDGQTATSAAKSGAGVFHPYAATGAFTVTAKAKAPCTGTASRQVSVVSGKAICQLLPVLINLGFTLDFFPFLFEPEITHVGAGPHEPGDTLLIFGKYLSKKPGKVELKGDFGPKYGSSIVLSDASWFDAIVYAKLPADIAGVKAQTISLRLINDDGKSSAWKEVPFEPLLQIELVPPHLVAGTCLDGTACTQCSGNTNNDCFFPPHKGSISASHISTAVVCALGGGSGTDHWNVNLKNGWTLFKTEVGPSLTFGSQFTPCNPPIDAASFSCDVSWKVEGCEELFYSINFFAIGPAGVPMG
jgi:hypothetical protein